MIIYSGHYVNSYRKETIWAQAVQCKVNTWLTKTNPKSGKLLIKTKFTGLKC